MTIVAFLIVMSALAAFVLGLAGLMLFASEP